MADSLSQEGFLFSTLSEEPDPNTLLEGCHTILGEITGSTSWEKPDLEKSTTELLHFYLTFSVVVIKNQTNETKQKKNWQVYLSSHFQARVHQSRKVIRARAWKGSWSYCIHSLEAESTKCSCLAGSFIKYILRPKPCMLSPTLIKPSQCAEDLDSEWFRILSSW